jgi:Protein of unknown function (DUF3617)
MYKTRVLITLCCCLFAVALFAWAQATRKPGLWEMTSTMTWQKSPMPPGMTMPPGAHSPFGGGPHTAQVCVTQAMIDKYGAPTPQSRNNQCQISNVVMKANGMTADWVCTGMMAGKGTVESSWTDTDHSTSKVHFAGTMQMGPNPTPVEYTIEATSVYKGPDCGSVKPVEVPNN